MGAHCFVVALDVAFEYSVLATLYAFGLIGSKLVLSILTNTLSQDSLPQHTGSLDGRVEQILGAERNIIGSIMILSPSLLHLLARMDFIHLLKVLELIILLLLHIQNVGTLMQLLLLLAIGSLCRTLMQNVLFILIGHQH